MKLAKCPKITVSCTGIVTHICGLRYGHKGKHLCRDCGKEFVRGTSWAQR